LNGSFDAVKKETNAPGTLLEMCGVPAEHWNAAHQGREMTKEIGSVPNLSKALTMAKGIIPKSQWNSNVLGELAAPLAEPAKVVQSGARSQVPQVGGVVRAKGAKSDGPRPKRNVKKRTYGDSSYEGYGEGYVDDEAQGSGYSTGEAEDRGSRKRPKKVCGLLCIQYFMADKEKNGQGHFQGPPVRQHSYGPGMVGV
jgi:hypothetical protein